jgi:hypothetical protein
MVIGWAQLQQERSDQPQPAGSAWAQVEAAQRQVRLPCLLVPQPAHAVLAGELAAGLTCFGELPPEIQRAIQMHDTGWASSDAQQIQRLRSAGGHAGQPVSFLSIPPREAEEAWTASIDTVEAFSRSGAKVVGRHFLLLAQHDQAHHQRFLQAEKLRQQKLEGGEDLADIDRWTAALGFCDLVSLYLLSGLSGPIEFPLAHPSSSQAQTANRVRLQIDGRILRFVPEAVRAGCVLSIQGLKHPVPAQGPRAETLTWEVQ